MAFCRYAFPLVLSVIIQCVASSDVPVYIWGDVTEPALKSNPLSELSGEEFNHLLKREIKDEPFTVVFIEETLSIEDLSRRNSFGETSFPYLRSQISDSVYLPSVESPLSVLHKLANPEKADHVKLTENGLSAEIEPQSGRFLFIYLNDAKEVESRSDLLRRHNDFMQDMFVKLQNKYGSVVAVYTAENPSWTVSHQRFRRDAAARNEITTGNLLLYVSSINVNEDGQMFDLGNVSTSSSAVNGTTMEATLNFSNRTLVLSFYQNMGYWFFNKVNYGPSSELEELQPSNEVFAMDGFSYRCAQNILFSSVNQTKAYTVSFADIKIQPFFSDSNSSDLVFGDSINCVGFFSVPIWSGLFVVFILLAITFYGIIMMMDIKTMDRFDDPKGKTITINASE